MLWEDEKGRWNLFHEDLFNIFATSATTWCENAEKRLSNNKGLMKDKEKPIWIINSETRRRFTRIFLKDKEQERGLKREISLSAMETLNRRSEQ